MFRMGFIAGLFTAAAAMAQTGGTDPLSYSIATPRPINPAAGTTNPSARATQTLNPYLGSVTDGKVVDGVMSLSLNEAIGRGLKFNLGLIESQQADVTVRAERERAFAALLPQIAARAAQNYDQVSIAEIGLKLPPQAGFHLPGTTGGFGFSDARISAQANLFNASLLGKYRARKASEIASELSTKDSRDVVVLAVGAAYFQVVASEARVATAQAALTSAREFEGQVADEFKAEVAPEIDLLRAQTEARAAEQRVTNATNDLEKDKLTLDRITGVPLEQKWTPAQKYGYRPLANDKAAEARFDLQSSKQSVTAAELDVKSARAQRLPSISLDVNYGTGGMNPGNYNQVYALSAAITVPLFTGGRIRSEVREAEAHLAQRQAESRDLAGRVDYDVRVARLDAQASESAVKVAEGNKTLAQKALTQSEDRYKNGVANYLEVVQAREAVVVADENYIASLFSFNVAKISLARALGSADTRLATLFDAE